jgi:hypothetical protein
LALAGGIAALLAGGGAFDGSLTGDAALGGGHDTVVRREAGQARPGESGADAARVAKSGAPAPTGAATGASGASRDSRASTASRASRSSQAEVGSGGTAAPGGTASGKTPSSGSVRSPGQVAPSAEAQAPGDVTSSGEVEGTAVGPVAPTTGGYVEPDEPYDRSGYKASGPSSHTDRQAAQYFRAHWGPGDKAASHMTDIRTVGRYLRIYTNLPGSAYNSRNAITLCERGLRYLKQTGESRRIVFVQARFGENGNPVLANILGPSDGNCRVSAPNPR